jgi:hypothetical protein
VRGAALVAIPLALFASINAFSGGGVSPTEVVVVPQRTVSPSPEPGLETLDWPAPKSIDPTLFHLDVRTIVLDAGHGASIPGRSRPTASPRRTSLWTSPGGCGRSSAAASSAS